MVYNKHLFLKFWALNEDAVQLMYNNFRQAYPLYGDNLAVVSDDDDPNKEAKFIIYQISHNGDEDHWNEALQLFLDLSDLNSDTLFDIGISYEQVSFVELNVMGDGFTDDERVLFDFIGGLTDQIKSVTIPLFDTLRDFESVLSEQKEEITELKAQLHHTQIKYDYVIDMVQGLAEDMGLDVDDINPSKFFTVQ